MAIVGRGELERAVDQCLETAYAVAHNIFVLNEQTVRAKSLLMGNLPKFSSMKHSNGYTGKAVVLSVDLRESSKRAVRIGPRDTYITMHTYLPIMAFLVGKAGGKVIGLRGDGLFASFGFVEAPEPVKRLAMRKAVSDAICCGDAMIEAVEDYINPALDGRDIEDGLNIGVGIAVGSVVVTRIGWKDAQEVTAYGVAVNTACKMRSNGHIVVTENVWNLLPFVDGGNLLGREEGGCIRLSFANGTPSMISDG